MPQTQFWARVRARAECPLRRGAWYRVVDLTPVEAYLDVNHRLLHIPRAFVQVLPLRPPLWSIVAGPRSGDGAGAPRVYGVCPSCCSRTPIGGEVRLADKKAAKRRRRENKEAREKAKAERTGPSPAQQAEAVRKVEAEATRQAERRTGLDGSVGGDTASNSRQSQ